MSFGKGWYGDDCETYIIDLELLKDSEEQVIAARLLKEKLAFCFERMSAKHKAIRDSRISNKDD